MKGNIFYGVLEYLTKYPSVVNLPILVKLYMCLLSYIGKCVLREVDKLFSFQQIGKWKELQIQGCEG
jgi:hypothetical protein